MASSRSSSGAPEPFEDFTGAVCGLHPPPYEQAQKEDSQTSVGVTGEATTSGGLAQEYYDDLEEEAEEEKPRISRSRISFSTLRVLGAAEEQGGGTYRSGGSDQRGGSNLNSLGESSAATHADRRLHLWIERLHGVDSDKQSESGSLSQPSTQRGVALPAAPQVNEGTGTGKSQSEIQPVQQGGPAESAEQVSSIREEEHEKDVATLCCARGQGAAAQSPAVVVSEEERIREEQNRRAEAIRQSIQRTQEASRCRERAAAREEERERIRRREKEFLALEARLCTIRKREREKVQSELAYWEKERWSIERKISACRQKSRQARRSAEDEVEKDRGSLGVDARLSAARVKSRERWIDRERQRANARAALGFEARSTWQRAIDRERKRILGLQEDHQFRSWEARRSTQREIERERTREREEQARRVQHRFAVEARNAGVRKIERERRLAIEWEVQKQTLALEARAALERKRDRVNRALESWYSDYAQPGAQDVAKDDDDAGSDIFDVCNLDSDSSDVGGSGELAADPLAPRDESSAGLASSNLQAAQDPKSDGEGAQSTLLGGLRLLAARNTSPTGSRINSSKPEEGQASPPAASACGQAGEDSIKLQEPQEKDDLSRKVAVLGPFGCLLNPKALPEPSSDESVAERSDSAIAPGDSATAYSEASFATGEDIDSKGGTLFERFKEACYDDEKEGGGFERLAKEVTASNCPDTELSNVLQTIHPPPIRLL